MLVHTVPTSIFDAAAKIEVLQVVFFRRDFFDCTFTGARPFEGRGALEVLQAISDIMFKFVGIVMAFAPIGIGGGNWRDGWKERTASD